MNYMSDITEAKKARINAYCPYSKFQVGALLRCKDGSTYTGCNIENHGIQSICAERTAFVKALSDGKREFESIAVVGSSIGKEPTTKCMPCGYCRQFISEYVSDDFIFIFEEDGSIITYTLDDLLPNRFDI